MSHLVRTRPSRARFLLALALFAALCLGPVQAQGGSPTPPGNSTWGANLFGGLGASKDEPVTLRLEVPPAPSVGSDFELVVVLVHGEGYHTYEPGEKMGIPLAVTPKPASGIEWGEPVFPPAKSKAFPMLGGEIRLYEGTIRIRVPGKVTEAAGLNTSFAVTVEYAACTDQACLLPQDVDLAGVWAGSTGLAAVPTGPAATPTVVATSASPATPPSGDFDRSLEGGLFQALLLAYLWGLAASLSPCVYPMIPVTIGIFAGGSGPEDEKPSRLSTLVRALVYVAGIVLSYALVGIAAARVGRDLGSLMVNPWVVGLVAGVLAAMGLSLLGLFEISVPAGLQERLGEDRGMGFAGIFFTGAVMGLVAAPCVGPFAASILLFVAQQGDVFIGALALASFGAGIGTLFLVLAMGVNELPRSGMWLIHVKKVFGYILLGVSLYYAGQLLPATTMSLNWGLYFCIGAGLGGALEPASDDGTRAFRGLMLAVLAAGMYLIVAGTSHYVPLNLVGAGQATAVVEGHGGKWLDSFDTARKQAAAEGRPIFADFYADWCIPCKQMDRAVFSDPVVEEELGHFVRAKLDCTQPESPAALQKNKQLGVLAMPYLAVFDAQGQHRPDLSHQGYLDRDEFLALLQRARSELGA